MIITRLWSPQYPNYSRGGGRQTTNCMYSVWPYHFITWSLSYVVFAHPAFYSCWKLVGNSLLKYLTSIQLSKQCEGSVSAFCRTLHPFDKTTNTVKFTLHPEYNTNWHALQTHYILICVHIYLRLEKIFAYINTGSNISGHEVRMTGHDIFPSGGW